MKILFVINNGNACFMEYEHTGILNSPKRRAVEIELTPEQIDKIGISKIGVSCGKDIMESVESVSIISDL